MTITTSIRIDTILLKQAKQYALDHDTTLAAIVRDGIKRVITNDQKDIAQPQPERKNILQKIITNKESIPFD